MADSAAEVQYRSEYIAGFEKNQALSRRTVTTEAMMSGNQAVFLVADSGSADAVTRGLNGDIPTRPDNLNQFTATLQEWHDIPERTGFNIFQSQGDGRAIMQRTSMAVMNRKIDKDINSALDTGTLNWGGAAVVTLALVAKAKTILGNNFACEEEEDELYAQISPAFHGELMQIEEFASADYIQAKPFAGVGKHRAFAWYGVNWIVNSDLSGNGTANCTCKMYNKRAIGHAANTGETSVVAGYDRKQDKSWARVTVYMGSKLLQNGGVVLMPHDDSNLSS